MDVVDVAFYISMARWVHGIVGCSCDGCMYYRMAEYPRLQVMITSILEEHGIYTRTNFHDTTLPHARNIHEPMPDHRHCHEHRSLTDEPVWTNSLGGWPLYCKGCVWIQLTRNSKFGSRIGKMRLAYQLSPRAIYRSTRISPIFSMGIHVIIFLIL